MAPTRLVTSEASLSLSSIEEEFITLVKKVRSGDRFSKSSTDLRVDEDDPATGRLLAHDIIILSEGFIGFNQVKVSFKEKLWTSKARAKIAEEVKKMAKEEVYRVRSKLLSTGVTSLLLIRDLT
ncbi:hypothetical protein COCNU_08G000970 [Cocos nucifera]|uniref:Uncharacterized protein n=1 Tax=Cocos nucifera TaxID=13894 RepID=A0A8K0IGX9_COCNU|nr:hypothetical protein COCNU_08G000970 [Cocos nucifera]